MITLIKKIITRDKTITFFNKEIQDYYHSQSGAEEEAKKKYAEPLKKKTTKTQNLVIYDICFGLGYNTAAVLHELKEKNIKIYCFENDKKILSKIPQINAKFKSYPLIKEFANNFLLKNQIKITKNNFKLIMIYGDFRKEIKKIKEKANYVLFDPFSPSKTPDLWTEEVFKEIHSKITKKGALFTYSCAKKVRENMKQAGFNIKNGPVVGRRSPSTIAEKP